MNNYISILKGYRLVMLIIAFMNLLIFINVLPSSFFTILIFLAVAASCALTIYIRKNRKNIKFSYGTERKTDTIITIIWLISLFAGMPR
ncbi:MAG: hypothetical protein ACI32Y_07385 [Clostridium sp.]